MSFSRLVRCGSSSSPRSILSNTALSVVGGTGRDWCKEVEEKEEEEEEEEEKEEEVVVAVSK